MAGALLYCLVFRHLEGAPLAGVLLCRLICQALKGEPYVGSYSIVQRIRRLLGQPLYCSAADAGLWGGAMVLAPPPTHDSAVSLCFHGCLAFLHRHSPPPSPPSNPSLCSQHQPSPWDCSTTPKFQLLATEPSRGPASLPRVCMAAARTV